MNESQLNVLLESLLQGEFNRKPGKAWHSHPPYGDHIFRCRSFEGGLHISHPHGRAYSDVSFADGTRMRRMSSSMVHRLNFVTLINSVRNTVLVLEMGAKQSVDFRSCLVMSSLIDSSIVRWFSSRMQRPASELKFSGCLNRYTVNR